MQPLLVDYNSPNISDTKGGGRREADGDGWRHEEWDLDDLGSAILPKRSQICEPKPRTLIYF
jgi:hypothetical protein